ncbi:Excitatory amino acid transporter 5 [Saguinus oedipus]|uniref:Amino acid transporter n=1 Tax=Saguinus oedipus TaxID=9490 RepID=A0ABQ9VD93_SAGOE|nr:Excitatory amino acid transporter 5 [Saguinus oedipus]
MSGLASLDPKTSSRLGILTVAYYLWTTFMAVIVGIFMVSVIHPGSAAQKETAEQSGKPVMSSADALLDLIRNMFPANLVEATFKQYRTKTTPVVKSPKVAPEEAPPQRILIYGVQEENGSRVQNFALDLTPPPEIIYKSEPGTSDGMNVLGIVCFSATMGTCCPPTQQCPAAASSNDLSKLESPCLPDPHSSTESASHPQLDRVLLPQNSPQALQGAG